MSREELLRLAEKLERAEGGAEADLVMYAWDALNPSPDRRDETARGEWVYDRRCMGSLIDLGGAFRVAETLLPDDCGYVLHNPIGKKSSAALQYGSEDFPAPKTVDGWGDYSKASTPALALCAAALKARANQEPGQ